MKLMKRDAAKFPEIPLTICPQCNAGVMAIKRVSPRLLRSGVDVEFTCQRCEAVVVSTVAPSRSDGAGAQNVGEPCGSIP